ncbi:MAG: hypothetical protein ACFCBU_01030 [Cyanophyceae cyanobacterium]
MMRRSLLWLGGLTLGLATVLAPMDLLLDAQGRSLFAAQAQSSIIIGDRWQRVYDRMPEIPLENTYVRRETDEVDPTDTLVTRMMRYHMYSKGRSTRFRLDWKLTLADYLGINELIPPDTYPSNSRLTENPRYGDIQAIAQLSRNQRNRLIETLIAVFEPPPDPDKAPQNDNPQSNAPQNDNLQNNSPQNNNLQNDTENREEAPPPTSNSASDLL